MDGVVPSRRPRRSCGGHGIVMADRGLFQGGDGCARRVRGHAADAVPRHGIRRFQVSAVRNPGCEEGSGCVWVGPEAACATLPPGTAAAAEGWDRRSFTRDRPVGGHDCLETRGRTCGPAKPHRAFSSRRQDPSRGGPDRFRTGQAGHAHTHPRPGHRLRRGPTRAGFDFRVRYVRAPVPGMPVLRQQQQQQQLGEM